MCPHFKNLPHPQYSNGKVVHFLDRPFVCVTFQDKIHSQGNLKIWRLPDGLYSQPTGRLQWPHYNMFCDVRATGAIKSRSARFVVEKSSQETNNHSNVFSKAELAFVNQISNTQLLSNVSVNLHGMDTR